MTPSSSADTLGILHSLSSNISVFILFFPAVNMSSSSFTSQMNLTNFSSFAPIGFGRPITGVMLPAVQTGETTFEVLASDVSLIGQYFGLGVLQVRSYIYHTHALKYTYCETKKHKHWPPSTSALSCLLSQPLFIQEILVIFCKYNIVLSSICEISASLPMCASLKTQTPFKNMVNEASFF